jgi:hypothetical protein
MKKPIIILDETKGELTIRFDGKIPSTPKTIEHAGRGLARLIITALLAPSHPRDRTPPKNPPKGLKYSSK